MTTGLPRAMASSMFLVRTNLSATKCVASEAHDAMENPNRATICMNECISNSIDARLFKRLRVDLCGKVPFSAA